MKLFHSFSSVIISLLFCCHCFAQNNRDRAVARSMNVLQRKLDLSVSQLRAVLLSMQGQTQQIDSLEQDHSMKIDERGKELIKIQNKYEQQLKGIFSKVQWKEYKEIESANRKSVLDRMKERKEEVKELPRNVN